ncbi:PAS domain S-box protein [Brumicola nitratireducens]|uniref:histidine kinase n=1 Tax=Glaciecola nitratireducens (strain JCM 12485 / KCTC 12276 / FR1064) TaxID=1085623 RepID=G4QN31_GLANF|nr:PAS domain S-box protein [Glaciecola nitratireducens]AEP31450.1 two-component hybrid sensor and regulator [Glaciecola nitratireducens FR1064]
MQGFWTEFFRGDYMPHGHCYLWQPGILWTNVISDLVIAFSYFSIPFVLLYMVQQRKDQKFKGVFILFALFILSCGLTHLFSVYTIWNGSYGTHGILKAITAVVSALTAAVLFLNLDKLIAIPTPAELKAAQAKAAEEEVKRMRLEVESRANSIFQFSIELFPTGVLVIDKNQNIQITNKLLEETFGYKKHELIHQDISILLQDKHAESHKTLVNSYMEQLSSERQMGEGRLVWGLTKSGDSIPVEVTLSVHEFENERYTFASVVSVSEVGVQKKQFLESSKRLQRAVDATDVGIWEWNVLTNQVWFSPKFISFLNTNKREEEMVFDDWLSHVHPEDVSRVQTSLEAHLEGKGGYDVLYRGKNSNNEYIWYRTVGDSIFDQSGKPLLMSGTLTNVNQLKVLQTELEDNNQFLDAVLAQSNSAIFIVDIKTNHLKFANKQVTSLWGYTNEELEELLHERRLSTLIHPEDLAPLERHIATLRTSKLHEKITFETRVLHKQGHWVWSLFSNATYSTELQGNPREILGSAVDVSNIKEREESNKRLAKEFLDTFEQAAVGIAHVGLDGSWLKVNNKICEILGYERDALLALNFQKITYPDDLSRDESLLQTLLDGEINHYTMEKRYIRKDTSIVWTRLTVSIVRHDDGTNNHLISVIEDINQQKSLESDLLKSNEELEQFAYVASHDLKEPLRTMQTYTSYLIADLKANKTERIKQDKEFIDNASKRMTSLIDDLLQFSRVGNAEVHLVDTNLSRVIQQVVDDLQTKISETQTTLEFDKDLPNVITDPAQLRLALQNLIQNAIKFSSKEGLPFISISVEQSDNQFLKIHVKDNGIGIEPSNQAQIFGLFKKLHGDTEYQGTGLGLAIVKKIMHSLSGDISVVSTPGQGSTFTLHIPYNQTGRL